MTVGDFPLRVLDLTDELALGAGRHFVGLGADVVRVGRADRLADAAALHWQAGQRIVPDREGEVDRLAGLADVVIESGPPRQLRGVDLTAAQPRSRWPGAVHVVVTPFGLTGPRRDWAASELVVAAAGGMAWLGGRPDGPPTPPPRQAAGQLAGTHAVIGALLALVARSAIGGQLVDISAQEAVAATLETGTIAHLSGAPLPRRTGGVYAHVAHRIFATADGYAAGGYSGSDRMWTDLLAWMEEVGAAEDLTDPVWADAAHRWANRPHVDEVVEKFAGTFTTTELAEQARARALPWAEVATAPELPANPQLQARGFVIDIERPGAPPVKDVGFAVGLRPSSVPAPRVVDDPGWDPRAQPPDDHGRTPKYDHSAMIIGGKRAHGVLSGLRVLDLTWVLAGPYATKQLAEHGADVIKIESKHRQDPTRFAPGMRLRPGAGIDDGGYFLNFNRNKRSVAINLKQERGVDLLRQLARQCDVVIDNYAPGVTARWGVDYASLVGDRPDVIVVSMSGVGATGPWRRAVTFADTLAAMSGLSAETAEAGGRPQGLTFGFGDMVAANAAVIAVLDHVRAGRGGAIDLSQLEAMAAAMGPAVLEAQLGPPPAVATAEQPNRSADFVPQGVYAVKGDDRWLALSVVDDAAWAVLRELVPGLAPWSANGLDARRQSQDAIDAVLADWTRDQDGDACAADLQAAGIAASIVATGADLADRDPQLAARGFYVDLEHPVAGRVRHEGLVAHLTGTPGGLYRAAPLLGEDTDDVLAVLLGLDAAQCAGLRAAGVLE